MNTQLADKPGAVPKQGLKGLVLIGAADLASSHRCDSAFASSAWSVSCCMQRGLTTDLYQLHNRQTETNCRNKYH
jgi:hypothetical protein